MMLGVRELSGDNVVFRILLRLDRVVLGLMTMLMKVMMICFLYRRSRHESERRSLMIEMLLLLLLML
jgi:hypothetical protein